MYCKIIPQNLIKEIIIVIKLVPLVKYYIYSIHWLPWTITIYYFCLTNIVIGCVLLIIFVLQSREIEVDDQSLFRCLFIRTNNTTVIIFAQSKSNVHINFMSLMKLFIFCFRLLRLHYQKYDQKLKNNVFKSSNMSCFIRIKFLGTFSAVLSIRQLCLQSTKMKNYLKGSILCALHF